MGEAMPSPLWKPTIADRFNPQAEAVILAGDAVETLKSIPNWSVKLAITSPPYNIGKVYEEATKLDDYLNNLAPVANEFCRSWWRTRIRPRKRWPKAIPADDMPTR